MGLPIPKGVFRKRLCLECVDDLERDGFLTNPERSTTKRDTCERCGYVKSITRVYRYTLTARERARRASGR